MNKKEKLLTAYLLNMAADQFSNHGCNDFNMAKEQDWSLEERRDLAKRINDWNRSPEDFDPDGQYKYFMDWVLMDVMADLLKEEAKQMKDV